MKVLQIGGTFVGAQQKIESEIHKHLQKNGHESYILYAIGNSADPNIICYENRFTEVLRRGLRKFVAKNPHFAFLGTLNIIRYINKIQPDLVNLHTIHHGYLDYILLLKYLAKKAIPVVYTAHDMWAFTGGCYYYTSIGCNQFQNGCLDCPKNNSELDCCSKKTALYFKNKMQLFKKLSKLSFVSVSSWVNSEMMKSELNSYPQYIIDNSVDEKECLPSNSERYEKFTIVGVAANWDERKGIKRFFELGEELGDSVDIILVGNIDQQLKKLAPNNINFVGHISDKNNLYKLYSKCDLHISMSYEETFGLTFIEAAFVGTKSLGFNSTAIPGVLEKTYGYIVESCIVSDAAEVIKKLLSDRECCKLSESQITEIKSHFSAEKMAESYLNVYEATVE